MSFTLYIVSKFAALRAFSRYLPKQLGHFQAQLTLYHCNGLYSLPLDCFGEAPVIAEKAMPVAESARACSYYSS